MSLDFFCYLSSKCDVTPAAIQERIGKWELLFLSEKGRKALPSDDPIPKFCLAWGWSPKPEIEGLVEAILANDQKALRQLLKKEFLACCELSEYSGFRANPEEMTFPESKRQRDQLIASTRHIETRTSAGGNKLSWKLQRALCEAIARIDGGLTEEPQFGEFKLLKAMKVE
jgi:hypothetical protein